MLVSHNAGHSHAYSSMGMQHLLSLILPFSVQVAAMQQDRFFTELRENADGFAVVAEHFGRGLMNMTNAAANPGLGPSN